MNSGNQVVTLADYGQVGGVLEPRLLEMGVKDGLTLAVEDTSCDNVGLDVLFFELQNVVLSLTDAGVFLGGFTHLVVGLGEGQGVRGMLT